MCSVLEVERKNARREEGKEVGRDRRPMASEERSEERITQRRGGRREEKPRNTGRSACATRN
jgi:hypothetical protein